MQNIKDAGKQHRLQTSLLVPELGVDYSEEIHFAGENALVQTHGLRTLGVFDQVKAKTRRVQGVSLMQLLTKGDIDVAITFGSEVDDPAVDVIGALPRVTALAK